MRPSAPQPGGPALQLGAERIEARQCSDPKCSCRQVVRYFVRVDGRLVAGGRDWEALLHYRGHYPADGLVAGQPIPRRGDPLPPRPQATAAERRRLLHGPIRREGPVPPPLSQLELAQIPEPS